MHPIMNISLANKHRRSCQLIQAMRKDEAAHLTKLATQPLEPEYGSLYFARIEVLIPIHIRPPLLRILADSQRKTAPPLVSGTRGADRCEDLS